MRTLIALLVLVSATAAPVAACVACDAIAQVETAPKDIALADLKTAIAAKTVVVLDANGSASFAKGHIPGALDFAAVKADLAKNLPADKGALIVAYCGGPKCGAWKEAATAAIALGYTNVQHFSGGLSGWKEGGEALIQ
jgi:rhodanese-related sulfurtransferase